MAPSKQHTQRELIVQIFPQNHESKKNAVKICEQVGIPVSTAYRVIKTYEETNSITRKKGSGRKSQKMSIKKKNTLKKKSKNKIGISCRKLASNFNISKSTSTFLYFRLMGIIIGTT